MKARPYRLGCQAWLCLALLACDSAGLMGPTVAETDAGSNAGGDVPLRPIDARPVTNELGEIPSEVLQVGLPLYQSHGCWKCHGEDGAGGSAPSLYGLDQRERKDVLAVIAERMPPNDPGSCTGECAETLTDFVREAFTEERVACDHIAPAPRALRLLNRREYVRTITSLLGLSQAGTTGTCGQHTFRYAPSAAVDSVLLAGDFTNWRAGALPMQKAADGSYSLEVTLSEGRHEYKYVLVKAGQDTWVSDPSASQSGDQGNSVLEIACADTTTPFDEAALFTLLRGERLGDGMLYDTSGLSEVDEGAVELYLQASESVMAAANLGKLVGCDLAADRTTCSSQFVKDFGRRAFRRPLSEAEQKRYAALLLSGDDPQTALAQTVEAFINSPSFLYRSELGRDDGKGIFELTPHELASALSYTLTGTMPDAALSSKADSGELRDPDVLETEAKRLMATELGQRMMVEFVTQWLGIQRVGNLERDPNLYPDLDQALSGDMLAETQRFVGHVLFESSATLEELLTADYSYPTPRLTEYYGLTAPADPVSSVSYGGSGRAGILGHASVLATYANPDATSPTKRGLFVRRNLMCQQFGTPPANAGVLGTADPSLSTRERFAEHTKSEACASCHQHIDPVGFAFEHFGAAGEWRDREGMHPVDASGALTGLSLLSDSESVAVESLEGLARALSAAPASHSCAARQIYRFAHGVLEDPLRACATRFVLQQYRASGGDLNSIPLAVFRSVDFRFRY